MQRAELLAYWHDKRIRLGQRISQLCVLLLLPVRTLANVSRLVVTMIKTNHFVLIKYYDLRKQAYEIKLNNSDLQAFTRHCKTDISCFTTFKAIIIVWKMGISMG